MSKEIIWSSAAENYLVKILEYLNINWNIQVVHSFLDILDQSISGIVTNPSQFPYFDKSANIRKYVVTKHNTLYFFESTLVITLLRLYDVRQNPNKLQF